jgi:hypothetical protein
VAYRLYLPEGARIHDVLNVGALKPFCGTPLTLLQPLPPLRNGRLLLQPECICWAQLHRGIWVILVQWAGLDQSEAT